MILNEPKYYSIVEVDLKQFMNKIFECNHYYLGKDSRSILESKGNYHVLETTPLCHKGSLVSIFLCDYYMMVAREPINEWIKFLTPTLSNTSSVNGVGNGSCKQASFNFLRLTQILNSPVDFLSWTTIGLIHSNYSTGSMIPASNIRSSFALTFYLYHRFNRYGHCLTCFALGFKGIFISPKYPTIPFIYENFIDNISVIFLTVSSSE